MAGSIEVWRVGRQRRNKPSLFLSSRNLACKFHYPDKVVAHRYSGAEPITLQTTQTTSQHITDHQSTKLSCHMHILLFAPNHSNSYILGTGTLEPCMGCGTLCHPELERSCGENATPSTSRSLQLNLNENGTSEKKGIDGCELRQVRAERTKIPSTKGKPMQDAVLMATLLER